MAGFLELIDNKLGKDFDVPVYDPSKGRAKAVAVIDKAAEQHKEGKTPPSRSWKLGNNNAIRFSPRLGSNPLLIGGAEDNYVPAERFQDFLTALKAAVEAGELDKEIKAALEGQAGSTFKSGDAAKGNRTGLGKEAKPDDPEWMARFREVRGEPDPSLTDPVPNSKGTKWIERATYERGKRAAESRKAG